MADDTMMLEPGADAFGDLLVQGEELPDAVWYVYRSQEPGTVLAAGARANAASNVGAYVVRISGAIDLEKLKTTVGPGFWKLIGRRGRTAIGSTTVRIAGVPWPESAFTPPPPSSPAPLEAPAAAQPLAPASGLPLGEITTLIRSEIRAALGGASAPVPGFPYPYPAPAAPAAQSPLELFDMALRMADRMAGSEKTGSNTDAVLDRVITYFEKGRRLGASMSSTRGDDDGEGSGLGELVKALVPPIVAALGQPRPAPAATPRAPGLALIPAAPAAPAAVEPERPAVVMPAAPAAAPAVAIVPTDRDLAVYALSRGLEHDDTAEHVADAVDFHLAEESIGGFLALGSSGDVTADLVRWLGPSSHVVALFAPNPPTVSPGFLRLLELVQRELGDAEPAPAGLLCGEHFDAGDGTGAVLGCTLVDGHDGPHGVAHNGAVSP